MFKDLIFTPRADSEEAKELLQALRKRSTVIGTDEAGRGALAGPVIAAAVCLTQEQEEKLLALKLRDSKKLTPAGREKIFAAVKELGIPWEISSGDIERIDRDNILQASLWTMKQCVHKLSAKLEAEPVCVVVDGTEKIPGLEIPQWTLIQADNLIPVVSAASIIAKVIRDKLMTELDNKYPGYDLAKNKGYPTQVHIDAVKQKGMSEIHIVTFCRKFVQSPEAMSLAAD